MPTASRLGPNWLLRPLLEVDRADLLAHALEHGLRWIEDVSNTDTRFDRNYLRQRISAAAGNAGPGRTQSGPFRPVVRRKPPTGWTPTPTPTSLALPPSAPMLCTSRHCGNWANRVNATRCGVGCDDSAYRFPMPGNCGTFSTTP